jgi:hypothetical protein
LFLFTFWDGLHILVFIPILKELNNSAHLYENSVTCQSSLIYHGIKIYLSHAYPGSISEYVGSYLRRKIISSPVRGVGITGRGEDIRKVCRRGNMVKILCIHVYKWKNDTC